MPTILILNSNSAEITGAALANGQPTAADKYTTALRAHAPDLVIRIAEPYRAALTTADLAGVDGVVFTGSGVTWSTDAPEAAPLRAAGEMVFAAGIPVVGSCNGLQLAAVLLGGAVGASPNGFEIGLARDITVTDEGESHAMMRGRQSGFAVPCIHRDEVQRLPDGAILLATNAHSPVQAMAYCGHGVDFWGMQYHPELPCASIARDVGDRHGIFTSGQNLAADLRIAQTDADAARRLGGDIADLQPATQTTELANWLMHIRA